MFFKSSDGQLGKFQTVAAESQVRDQRKFLGFPSGDGSSEQNDSRTRLSDFQ